MGSIVLSVDAELAWGFHDLDPRPVDRLRAGREGWCRLLALLDEFDVPATWAVVGHLLLDACDGVHADHPTPDGWFDHERGPDAVPADLRFGRDLVRSVLRADPEHEIGAHTFSHVEFDDPATSRRVARAEVAAALEAAARLDLRPLSFVFPRNGVGHRDVLAEYGFSCYRGKEPGSTRPSLLQTAVKLARGTVVDRPPPLVQPRIDDYGLVDVPASLYLFGFEGAARAAVEPLFGDPITEWARRGIDRAVDEPGVLHLWLHPNNLVAERDVRRVRSILQYLDRRRSETSLRVETMRDVADGVLDSRRAGDDVPGPIPPGQDRSRTRG